MTTTNKAGRPLGSVSKGNFWFTKATREFWNDPEKVKKPNELLWTWLNSDDPDLQKFAIANVYKYMVIPVDKQFEVEESQAIDLADSQGLLKQIQERVSSLLDDK